LAYFSILLVDKECTQIEAGVKHSKNDSLRAFIYTMGEICIIEQFGI